MLAAALLGLGGTAPAQAADRPELALYAPQDFHFVAPEGGPDAGNRFESVLYAKGRTASGDEINAEDVVAEFDASELKGKVTLSGLGVGCTAVDYVVTCRRGDFYQRTEVVPFTMVSVAGVPVGEAGTVRARFSSSNAGAFTHDTRVFVGKPKAALGAHPAYRIPVAQRRAAPPLTPAFGNEGQVAAPRGVLLYVRAAEAVFTGPRYSNCFYPQQRDTTYFYCAFPKAGGLKPGTAFRTEKPFTARTVHDQMKGGYEYRIETLGALPEYDRGYRKLVRGTGQPLGLVSVPADTLSGEGQYSFQSEDYEQGADWTVQGITVRGRVGDVVETDVPNPAVVPEGPRPSFVRVDLPEGTELELPGPGEGRPGVRYCGLNEYQQVSCEAAGKAVLRLRILKEVKGARGQLVLGSEPANGEVNPADNKAPVYLAVTPGPSPSATPSGTPSGTASPTPSGSASATASPSPSYGTTAGTGGNLSNTGAGAAWPAAAGAVGALLLGSGALYAARRRRAAGAVGDEG
ncbi:LPXTG cell wall anchor domain-containing protein [Streptomyces bambusae]|uniref:LPXTG cell wall anchor domain-containing protein n=1 Tax=Streptomyces bambusae TaxID=1550616 RepID=UPI001CFF4CD9|nr:LPXTG cell wall anchor domain-containing protein [Streptomyces bambusae]MCB5164197.1 LPXTG cell wall anchor domain-containing protein [Streptomyces bambusae]